LARQALILEPLDSAFRLHNFSLPQGRKAWCIRVPDGHPALFISMLLQRRMWLQMTVNAPRDLPSFDDTYQRHLGVLDTLRH